VKSTARDTPLARRADQRNTHLRVAALSHLERLSALVLIDRTPVPTLVIGGALGDIVHLNVAFLNMLVHSDGGSLIGSPVTEIVGRDCRCTLPHDQIELFRLRVGSIMTWRHAQGHSVETVVSPILQMRRFDPLLVVSLIEISDGADGDSFGGTPLW
jgi:hypothetical protein